VVFREGCFCKKQLTKGTTMTKLSIALTELAEKGADVDVLREMLQFISQRMMDLDVEGLCGAPYGERGVPRENLS